LGVGEGMIEIGNAFCLCDPLQLPVQLANPDNCQQTGDSPRAPAQLEPLTCKICTTSESDEPAADSGQPAADSPTHPSFLAADH